jgi:hypothetical protein
MVEITNNDSANHQLQTAEIPEPLQNKQHPTPIPFEDDELDNASVRSTDDISPPQRHNLCSHARHIIQSAIDDGLVIPQDRIEFAFIDDKIGKALEYCDLIKMNEHKQVWSKSYANELGRLTQGISNIPWTNTMFFIHKSDIPVDCRKDITYGQIVVVVSPQKKEKERTRLTLGGNLIDYP